MKHINFERTKLMPKLRPLLPILAFVTVALIAAPAYAAPGGTGPLVGFVQAVANLLIWVLGPGFFLIGMAFVAYSMFFGNPNAKQNGMNCLLGAAVLFGSGQIVDWIVSVTH
jgi:type IV secretory pathway VirB2 component (pilin)